MAAMGLRRCSPRTTRKDLVEQLRPQATAEMCIRVALARADSKAHTLRTIEEAQGPSLQTQRPEHGRRMQRLLTIGGAGLRQRGAAERALARAEAEVTSFRMVLNGEIESAELGFSGRGPLMCVFSMQHGPDWSLVSGAPNGITQLACTSVPSSSSTASAFLQGGKVREVVWNFPIGLVYKSTSPFGWPRIVVSVYGTDLCNRRIIKGYGSAHVPCQPGRHKRTIRLYCPLSSSPLTRLLGALFGNPAQLVDPRLVAGTEGREVVRTQSNGKVQVSFDVLLKDTEPFNYTF